MVEMIPARKAGLIVSAGVLELAHLVHRFHEVDQVSAGQLGQAVNTGAFGVQPQPEPAQPAPQAGHAVGAQHQGAFGDEPVHDRGDARLAAQRQAGQAAVRHWEPAGDAAVEQRQPGAVGAGAPGRLQAR